jgi:hypothetical protein
MSQRIKTAEENVGFSATDYLTTYTASGIGVQCAGIDTRKKGDEANSGVGIGQITDNQTQTAYGDIVVGNRGGGVRCYIKISRFRKSQPCSYCFTKQERESIDEFEKKYELEPAYGQMDSDWAVIYMRRRIEQAIKACKNCSATDRFIVVALAQNGSGFTRVTANEISSTGPDLPYRKEKNGPIDWEGYIQNRINTGHYLNWFDTRYQLDLFGHVAWALYNKGWAIEDGVDWTIVWKLAKGNHPK